MGVLSNAAHPPADGEEDAGMTAPKGCDPQ